MTELDATIGPLASGLIDQYGKNILFGTVTSGEYDTITGSTTEVINMRSIKAIVEDYSLQGSGAAFASGLIETGDKKLTIAAASFPDGPPTPEDYCEIDNTRFKALNIKATYSGELVALYEIQVRRQ
jgi:hypothetical protein